MVWQRLYPTSMKWRSKYLANGTLDESTITVVPTAAGGAVTFAQGGLTGPGAQQDDKPVLCLYAGGKLVAFGPEELNSLNHVLFRLNLDRARQGL